MVAWPTDLPQSVLIAGYKESAPDTGLRSSVDVGPAKTRRRLTAEVRPEEWPLILTTAQVEVLDTFYTDTIKGGSLSFTHTDPRTGSAKSFRITEAPGYIPASHSRWRTTLKIELMP